MSWSRVFTGGLGVCFGCGFELADAELLVVALAEPEIYRNCLEGLGIRADEAVFFDDLERNITAAKKLGCHGFVWTGVDQAQKDWLSCL